MTCLKYLARSVVFLSLPLFALGYSWENEQATNTAAAKPGTEKLRVLEQKANDRDLLAIKIQRLEEELEWARAEAAGGTQRTARVRGSGGFGRLQEMERKALAYDSFADKLQQKETIILNLTKRLDSAESSNKTLLADVTELSSKTNELSGAVLKLTESEKSLRATIEQLLLGNYEYYEVKEGDTLASIAAKPLVYGDKAMAEWLRQANHNHVGDPDKLRPGETLVVPRFPVTGNFAF